MKIANMSMTTPLGKIILSSPEWKDIDQDEFSSLMEEWGGLLSEKTNNFRFPTEGGKFYVIPKNILCNSYIEIDIKD